MIAITALSSETNGSVTFVAGSAIICAHTITIMSNSSRILSLIGKDARGTLDYGTSVQGHLDGEESVQCAKDPAPSLSIHLLKISVEMRISSAPWPMNWVIILDCTTMDKVDLLHHVVRKMG